MNLFAVPFDVKEPVATPRGLKTGDPRVRQAMVQAIGDLEGAGIPLDASLRDYQYAQKGDLHLPIPGGSAAGQYNIVGDPFIPGQGHPPVVFGASFVMWMQFTPQGPVGESILTFSQSPDPASRHYADQTRMWSEMKTKKMLFNEADILSNSELKTVRICTGSGC